MLYFVNRRWISNPSLGHAVITAFHTLLPTRRFPVAVLFIELPEEQVDVNVHPTKKEVKVRQRTGKFTETIVRAIRSAVRWSALSGASFSRLSDLPLVSGCARRFPHRQAEPTGFTTFRGTHASE